MTQIALPSSLQSRGDSRTPTESRRGELLGMPLDFITERETLAILEDRLSRRQGTWVMTPNLDILRLYHEDASVRPLFATGTGGADLLVADGMPLVWASRMAKAGPERHGLPERVPGSGLVFSVAEMAARRGNTIFLLGGEPGTAERAGAALRERYPGLKIAGTCCPERGFENTPERVAAIREQLVRAKPDIVYVALGFPKQERLTQVLRPFLPRATFLGVGISLSFITGDVRRAPRWMQAAGLEWAHRMAQEPRRLMSRYLGRDLPFALTHLFPGAVASRFRAREPAPMALRDAAEAGDRWKPPIERKGTARNPRDRIRTQEQRGRPSARGIERDRGIDE